MNVKLIAFDPTERTATIKVGAQEKVIAGLGDMDRNTLITYLHAIAEQEFGTAPDLDTDLSDLVGKNLPQVADSIDNEEA